MRLIKRVNDSTSYNLDFYTVEGYAGTLKFSMFSREASDFIDGLRTGELGERPKIDYEEITYLNMLRKK